MESTAYARAHKPRGREKLASKRRLPKHKRAQEYEDSQPEELSRQEVRLPAVRQELQVL